MNKAELIGSVAESTGLSRADATRAVEAFIDCVQQTLKKGDAVSLVGFGNFTVRKRAARTGRNPRTNETIEIPASNIPAFKPGKPFKDAIN